MRRLIIILIAFVMLLSGCSGKEYVKFYYSRAEYQYESQDSVIVSELRDITGHSDDLPFLISLYLMGPLEQEFVSVFPSNVKLLRTHFEQNHIDIEISPLSGLTDAEYSLACACMALTCFELTEAGSVTITSENRTITIDPSILTLYDSGIPIEATVGG